MHVWNLISSGVSKESNIREEAKRILAEWIGIPAIDMKAFKISYDVGFNLSIWKFRLESASLDNGWVHMFIKAVLESYQIF